MLPTSSQCRPVPQYFNDWTRKIIHWATFMSPSYYVRKYMYTASYCIHWTLFEKSRIWTNIAHCIIMWINAIGPTVNAKKPLQIIRWDVILNKTTATAYWYQHHRCWINEKTVSHLAGFIVIVEWIEWGNGARISFQVHHSVSGRLCIG